MYPRISDLLNDFFGTNIILPVQTYGFFVAAAFASAGYTLYLELRRKEKIGLLHPQSREIIKGKSPRLSEYLFSAILYFLIGFKGFGIIFQYAQFVSKPQDYLASADGSIAGGIGLAVATLIYIFWKGKKNKLEKPVKEIQVIHPMQLTPAIVLIAAVSGILGAKIFDLAEHPGDFFRDPVGSLISFSGLTFYGGFIVATFAVAYYGEINKIKWPIMADAVAPALMLAYAVGRIGCQLSGDGCWGIPNPDPKPAWLTFLPDWMWSYTFPHNVIKEGFPISGCHGDFCFELGQAVFPTSFYETSISIIFFIVLWSLKKQIVIPGFLFSFFLIFNGIERYFIEFIRVNIQYNVLGINVTQAQMIALGLVITGILGFFYFKYRYKSELKTKQKI